jgi:hypothetical protein
MTSEVSPEGLYFPTDITPEQLFQAMGKLRRAAMDEIERLIAFLDATEPDPDAEPSLGWQTGNQSPEHHSQAAPDFSADGNAGDDREEEDEREPPVDDEASLGWTDNPNQANRNQVVPAFWGLRTLRKALGRCRRSRRRRGRAAMSIAVAQF